MTGNEHGYFQNAECLWVLTAGMMMLVPMSRADAASPLRHKPHVVLGGMIVIGVVLSVTEESSADYWARAFLNALRVPWGWMLIAVIAVLSIIALAARRWLLVAVAFASVIPALVSLGIAAAPIQWVMIVHLFLVGVFSIGVELTGGKGAPRLGALLVCALVAARFADSEQTLIAKGLIFLIVGAALLGVVAAAPRTTRSTP